MRWVYKDPAVGDIVRVKLGSIYHYGIYAPCDEVIQFGLPPTIDRAAESVRVLSSSVDRFLAGGFLEVGEPTDGEKKIARKKEQVYICARSRIGEGGYDIIHNNCEHFAYECMFGIKYCSQVGGTQKLREHPIVDVYVAKLPFDVSSQEIYPNERATEIAKCGAESVRAEKFYVWKLLEHAFSRTFGLDMRSLGIKKNKNGKWTCPKYYFSLSHSGDIVAVAISRKPLGVDIEKISDRFDGKLGSEMLTAKEIRNAPNEKSTARLYVNELWTVKEAIFKLGGGKSFVPDNIETEKVKRITKIVRDDTTEYFLTVVCDDAEKAVFVTHGGGLTLSE